MIERRVKVLEFANKISRVKMGSRNGVTYDRPEYKILVPYITDEKAEVGLYLEFRKGKSADQIALESGMDYKNVDAILKDLAWYGAAVVNEIDGIDQYWLELWVPGHVELIVNSREVVKLYPHVSYAFEEYGQIKGPAAAGLFPVGTGPMRVIPIESAIDGQSRRASYEEISMYLEDNTVFSVSDCSCRTSRETMGEGCGHLKEDMCIQMGHAANYYIKTKRGRQISREEAYEILARAEENGLMHMIPNVDGPGKTHAICNCCGCSCYALRNATMVYNNDFVRSNYVSSVDEEKCSACGECVEICPTNAAKLGQKLCSSKPIAFESMSEVPSNTEWGSDKFNIDYRTNRENVVDDGTSPCKTNCPAHISVQGYIKLAAQGKYREALELIKHENPFPAVCGRICPKKCEDECTRGDIDDPVSVDEIKKFIAEQDLKSDHRFVPKKMHDYGKKIAIIGAGPSGLSCAYYLAIDGYNVTVFEKEDVLGGMLTLGIPAYRLEKDVINSEIEVLRELDVSFKTGVNVGKDVSLNELRADGYEAFYLAIGASEGRKLDIENADLNEVITGLDFLRDVNLDKDVRLEGEVIVIGGGNVAIDVARTAARKGASNVNMFSLESRESMPALEEEIIEALEEGIHINNGWGPSRIISKDDKVTGIEFRRCLSTLDDNGKFNPIFSDEIKIVKADHILVSIGQSIKWENLIKDEEVKIRSNNTIEVDEFTLQTAKSDIFAGGDVATGPRFAIDAIALGKEAAISIHRYVQPGQSLLIGRDRREFKIFDKENLMLDGYDNIPRQTIKHISNEQKKLSFNDNRETFSEEQVKIESERCLSCGATKVDEYICVGCGACTTVCKFDAISLNRKYDKSSVEFEKLKGVVVRNAIKRKGKIITKKIRNTLRT